MPIWRDGQMIAQRVAEGRGNADHILVEHVQVALALAGQDDQIGQPVGFKETLVAHRRPRVRFCVQASRCRSLTRSTAAWMASSRELKPTSWWWYLGSMPWTRSRASERAEREIVGQHHAAVAAATQVLGRIEAEGRRVAQAARSSSLVDRADGLGRVFEHEQIVLAGDRGDRVHLGGLTIKMNRDDRHGSAV